MHDADLLAFQMGNLILESKANSTWNKHFSAWKLYNHFCSGHNLSAWPATIDKSRAFATWAITERSLKSETVRSYISSLTLNNTLCGGSQNPLTSDLVIKMILKGADNRDQYSAEKFKPKLSVNPYMLKILGHRISNSDWGDMSKQVCWTALVVCFFSSCRMGEIVVNDDYKFDPKLTLTWENLDFSEPDGALMHIPFTKTKGARGEYIDLFCFKESNYCPIKNLLNLRNMLISKNLYSKHNPVFMLESGAFLTKKKINDLLAVMLSDIFDSSRFKITCHSFRTSIPSLLAGLDGNDCSKNVKIWGRWVSDSYTLYTKNVRSERKCIFKKIVNVLHNIL